MRCLLAILILATIAGPLYAHEMRPAYLELKEAGDGTWSVLFQFLAQSSRSRVGASGNSGLSVRPDDLPLISRKQDAHRQPEGYADRSRHQDFGARSHAATLPRPALVGSGRCRR